MGEFFKPWRRKFGALSLVMTLGLMAGWVRSLTHEDEIVVTIFQCVNSFGSESGSVSLWSWIDPPVLTRSNQLFEWTSRKNQNDFSQTLLPNSGERERISVVSIIDINPTKRSEMEMRTLWQLALQTAGELGPFPNDTWTESLKRWTVPYWSIVTPLTLLSTWLLLSKPRQDNPREQPLASAN